MCKILCLTSHDPAQRNAIILKVWGEMAGQTDGYGAAWFGVDGQIGYFKRSHAAIYGYDSTDGAFAAPSYVAKKKAPIGYVKPRFHESNDIPSDGGFLIIHGRNATSAVNVANTHPMVMPGAALVHNGIVQATKYANELTGCTCDSELLMRAYLEGGLPELEDEITGYYAFFCLQIDETNEKTLHVVKDSKANLYCGIGQDQTRAFATTEGLLKAVGTEPMGEMEDDTAIIFTGKIEHTHSAFSPCLTTPTSKEFLDKTNTAFGTRRLYDDEYDAYDTWQGVQPQHGQATTFPRPSSPASTTATPEQEASIKRDLEAIERMERQAIDDKVFELAGKAGS